MIHQLLLFCLLCAAMTTVNSFFHNIAATPRPIVVRGMMATSFAPTFETPKATWTVEEDTAEVEWGSSVDKLRSISMQIEEKRLRDVEILVAPMDEFRKKHDPVFKAFIERTGYSPLPPIESLPTATSSSTASTSTTSPLSSLWNKFVSRFQ